MTNHTIYKSYFQTIKQLCAATQCVVCGDQVQPTGATAGPCNADGSLALICNRHLRDSRQMIGQLADYMVEERQRFMRRPNFMNTERVVPDAWFLY